MDLVSTQEYQEDERRRTDLLDESIKDMFENSSETIEEVSEDLEKRWVGDEEQDIPETANQNVGRRPKPTIVVNLQNETVNDSRLIKSLNSGNGQMLEAPLPNLPSSQQAQPAPTVPPGLKKQLLDAGIIPLCISESKKKREMLKTPCKLQYLGYREQCGKVFAILSDGCHTFEVAVLNIYNSLFMKKKIPTNNIFNIMELRFREGDLTMTSFRVIKGDMPRMGDPAPLK